MCTYTYTHTHTQRRTQSRFCQWCLLFLLSHPQTKHSCVLEEGENKKKVEKEGERGRSGKHSELLCLAGEKKFWFTVWIWITEAGQSSCHSSMEMEYIRPERLVEETTIFPSFHSHLLPLVIWDAYGGIFLGGACECVWESMENWVQATLNWKREVLNGVIVILKLLRGSTLHNQKLWRN